MKILVVSQYFWPENFRINDLSAALVERGHQVTVLTGIPNYPKGDFFPGYGLFTRIREEYKGVRIIRVPLIPRGNGSGIRLALNYLSYVIFACLLSPLLCRGKFDLIFVCQLSPVTVGLPAIFLKTIKKIPILFWILDLWPESLSATGSIRSEKALVQVNRLVRFIYRGCDKIVVSSKGFLRSIKEKGIEEQRTGYLPNWYEPEYKTDSPSPPGILTSDLPEGFLIMFAGNIGVAQDFGTILSAAEKLKSYPDIHWVIIGDGRQYSWVQEQVESRGLADSVHLLGRYPPEAMPTFFSQADVMLVSLKKDPIFSLTVPGKVQSYMACGRPILAALDGEGSKLITESGAGFSSPAEDAGALADSVLKMYLMPVAEREEMGRRGRVYCELNFEREMLVDRLEGWLNELTT